jgi:hypothetical protein
MIAKGKLVTIHISRRGVAEIIKGRLESEGIPVMLSYESAGLVCGLTINGWGEVKIMVPAPLAKEARKVLGI